MNRTDKKINKLKIIILMSISILAFFYNIAFGYGRWIHLGSPPNERYLCNLSVLNNIGGYRTYVPNQDGETGYHTINYGNIDAFRRQLSGSFQITLSSDMVYCCDNNRTTRNGTFDNKTWYIADYVGGDGTWHAASLATAKSESVNEVLNGAFGPDRSRIWSDEYRFTSGISYSKPSSSWESTHRYDDDENDRSYYSRISQPGNPPGFSTSGNVYYGKWGFKGFSTEDIDDLIAVRQSATSSATDFARTGMQYVFGQLSARGRVDPLSGEQALNGVGSYSQGAGDEGMGPIVTIVQEHNTKYPNAQTYNERGYVGTPNQFNDARAYVLTAARKLYNPNSYNYGPLDIQVAWWNLVDNSNYSAYQIGDGALGRTFSGRGITLRNEAVRWDAFISHYNTPEKVAGILKIYSNNAEAIINQDKKQYVIGPFTIDYPDQYEDFMYVKGFKITLRDDKGETIELKYNEIDNEFDFVYPPNNSGTQGRNGLTKYYPKRGNQFYVRFDLTKTKGLKPVHIDLTPAVEYLSACHVDGIFYHGYANSYPYIGHYITVSNYASESYDQKYVYHNWHDCPITDLRPTMYYYSWRVDHQEDDPNKPLRYTEFDYFKDPGFTQYAYTHWTNELTWQQGDYVRGGGDVVYPNPSYYKWAGSSIVGYEQRNYYDWKGEYSTVCYSGVYVFQPYIKMSKIYKYSTGAQPFEQGYGGSRTYSIVNKTASLDFTMRVGGMVFEDVRSGKNNVPNGAYSSANDKLMPNVMVLLYRHEVDSKGDERGEYVKSTWTDSNGIYSFEELNEMYKYHVEFLYNGQYYEPTKLTTKESYEGTSKNKWDNSSKSIDNYEERDEFNAKFEEVGSSDKNVILSSNIDNKRVFTYESDSRDVVEASGNMDAYGNINKRYFQKLGNEPNNPNGNIGFISNPNIWRAKYGGYIASSMLRAYSGREGKDRYNKVVLKYDLYPFKGLFVADQQVKSPHQSVIKTGTIVPLYEKNKNLTERINLGLVRREELDMSLQKDVYKVIFEMNGKKFVYKYNNRLEPVPEGEELRRLIEREGIKAALDRVNKVHYSVLTRKANGYAYYKEEDSRLVYREDYEYNSGLYKNLKIQNEDGTTSKMSSGEYDQLIEAKEKGELEIYVIYRITLRNFSSGLNGKITEIVDHSDSEFTLITNSTTCSNDENARNKVVQGKVLKSEVDKYRPYIGTGLKAEVLSNEILNETFSSDRVEQQFSEMVNYSGGKYSLKDADSPYLTVSDKSIYRKSNGDNVELVNFGQNGEYNTAYITGMENIYLTVDYNDVDLYLTYRVNKRQSNVNGDDNEYLIIDERIPGLPIPMPSTNPKSNLAEIRGYKSYYSTYAKAPNVDNTKNQVNAEFVISEDKYKRPEYIAGILDANSTPGNLQYAARVDERPNDGSVSQEVINVARENDADRAPLLRLILNMEQSRQISGSTFEDARTINIEGTAVGDGRKNISYNDDGKYADGSDRAINGTRVQLIELVDGKEVIWKEVKVGDKQTLYPVIDPYGLIGTYDLENTYYKTRKDNYSSDVEIKIKTVSTGLVDGDKKENGIMNVDNDTTGHYRILGFPTGDFIVRFIYGSDADTAIGTYGYDYTIVDNEDGYGNPIPNEIAKPNKTVEPNVTENPLASYDGLTYYKNALGEVQGIHLPPLKEDKEEPINNNNQYNDAKYYYRQNVLKTNDKADRSVNEKSYTGNDYKSTIYRQGYYESESDHSIDYLPAVTGNYDFDFGINDNGELLSDAKDIYSRRQKVIDYSDNDQINHIAEVLASFEECRNIDDYKSNNSNIQEQLKRLYYETYLKELYFNTYMYADSGVIHVDTEYNRTEDEVNKNDNTVGKDNYTGTGFFSISNLDFGLEERPKAQLKTNVEVANLKITLANQNVIFDATKTATNLQWYKHVGHGQDSKNLYTGEANYTGNSMKIPKVRLANDRGLISATMDQELLQGAKIEVTYLVTVANVGEIDYYQNNIIRNKQVIPYCSWYNKHYADKLEIVKTKAKELVCYVGTQTLEGGEVGSSKVEFSRNNLKFSEEDNEPIWETVEQKDICNQKGVSTNIVNYRYNDQLKKYNTIIHTTDKSAFFQRELVPIIAEEFDDKYKGSVLASDLPSAISDDPLNSVEKINRTNSIVGEKLVLTSTLSGDFGTNDMTYNNLVEIVRVDNKVGRRMAFSIVGNQDPTADPMEIDADFGEEITILPPFGEIQFDYYLGFGLAGIMILGGVLVMIFVRKKK